jgi:hypothetical protein
MTVLPKLLQLLRLDIFFYKICFYKQKKKTYTGTQIVLLASHHEASGSIPDIILMLKEVSLQEVYLLVYSVLPPCFVIKVCDSPDHAAHYHILGV